MELKFSASKKPVAIDVITKRRQRLIGRIDQQVSLMQNAKEGAAPKSSWVWIDDAGAYLVPIKYGQQQIELKKGMFSVQCGTLHEVTKAFEAVRTMVLNGEFDQQLAKASQDVRSKFGKLAPK